MPRSCCIVGCKSRGKVHPPGVRLYELPWNKPNLLTQWLIALDWVDCHPNPSQRICNLHFCTEDYISKSKQKDKGRKYLKPDAIPSIFPRVVKKATPKPDPKMPNSDSLDSKNKVIKINSGGREFYLSYADFNPVVDLTKNNILFKKESLSSVNSTNDVLVERKEHTVPDAAKSQGLDNNKPNTKKPKSDSLDLKNKVIKVKSGEKIYLSYADLYPVVDLTKNKVLLKEELLPYENSTNDVLVVKKENTADADKNQELDNNKPNPKRPKSDSNLKNKIIKLKRNEKEISLSYAEVKSIVDMANNNVLFMKESLSTESSTNDILVVNKENTVADADINHELDNNTLIRKCDNSKDPAPLCTYISPISKTSEKDILEDDSPKKLIHSKVKLQKEDICSRYFFD